MIVIDPRVKFSEAVAHPKLFMEFLHKKMKRPMDFIKKGAFNISTHTLDKDAESIRFHVYAIHVLLGIRTSKRDQKEMIINYLIK